MAFTTTPPTSAYDPAKALPQHLEHKPVFALPYSAFDGSGADPTDVQFVSVGLAQYDQTEVSVKTMRHIGSQWTRQAEELPLNRPIDMTIFLAKVIFDSQSGAVHIPAQTFRNQTSVITITPETRDVNERAQYNAAIASEQALLRDRLNSLRDVLNDLSARGMI